MRGRSVLISLGVAGAIAACAAMIPTEGRTQTGGGARKPTPTSGGKVEKQIDLSKPFSHESHGKELRREGDRLLGCPDCHALSSTVANAAYPVCTTNRMPFPSHDKCNKCHSTAFFVQPLVICANCHIDNKFSEQPPMREQTTRAAPLQPDFSHKLHMDPTQRVKKRFDFGTDCTFCHTFSNAGAKVDFPAHPQCCECHTQKDVQPNINDCAGCHKRPETEKRPKSLIEKFSHADHQLDPRNGLSLECSRCHFAVAQAEKVGTITMPIMATCVECHSGEVAFDYAQCLKCHEKSIAEKPVPPSHEVKKP